MTMVKTNYKLTLWICCKIAQGLYNFEHVSYATISFATRSPYFTVKTDFEVHTSLCGLKVLVGVGVGVGVGSSGALDLVVR